MKLHRTSPDGRENMLAVLGPGELIGELSLFDPGPRTATATALTEVKLLGLGHGDLQPWLNVRPEVATALLRAVARRLRKTNDQMSDLVFSDVPGRVARALLDLSRRFGVQSEEGIHVVHDLTQEELAQLVGASRETVNKALADFARPRMAAPGGARGDPAGRRAAGQAVPLTPRPNRGPGQSLRTPVRPEWPRPQTPDEPGVRDPMSENATPKGLDSQGYFEREGSLGLVPRAFSPVVAAAPGPAARGVRGAAAQRVPLRVDSAGARTRGTQRPGLAGRAAGGAVRGGPGGRAGAR